MILAAKQTFRALVGACACALLLGLLAALPAQAGTTAAKDTPCWAQLLNDWYKPPIDKLYPIPCYRDAINHLPTDVDVYSSAREDIQRALAVAIAHEKGLSSPPPPASTTTGAAVTETTATEPTSTVTTTAEPDDGPIPNAIKDSSPGGATSFPLPLIILGGLALFLIGAGAVGLIVRRMQDRDSGTT